MKKVAIIQSSYIPWKGYFDIINEVDTFVFLDDVQLTKRDWRTRNKIKTPKGTEWLTVPVSGGRDQLICQTQIAGTDWQERHLKSWIHNYARAPFFSQYRELLAWLYERPHDNLSEYNRGAIEKICNALGITTELRLSVELAAAGTKDDRIIDICQKLGAEIYVSGPSAREYIVAEKFERAGIQVSYKDYFGYPEYRQRFAPFNHAVSILDLLFSCGPSSPHYIWGWRAGRLTQEQRGEQALPVAV